MADHKMTEAQKRFEFYMDLLGHDILNSNQAVMSYLELILSTPGVDKKVKGLAEKAISHVRTSTLLVENLKRIVASRSIDPGSLRPLEIVSALENAESQVRWHFPGKMISLSMPSTPRRAMAVGGDFASDLLMNVLATAVRLNPGNDVRLDVTLVEDTLRGKPAWVVRIEDKNAVLPPFLGGEGVAATYDQDTSVAVRSTGMLFAKMMADNIGGEFDAHPLASDPKLGGAVYAVTLRRAEDR